MLNEEQKMRFVEASYPASKREEVLGLLRLFAPYEASWTRDLVMQPIEKLQPAFNEIAKTIPAKKANALLTALKRYRKWFLENNDVKAVCAGVLLLKMNTEDKLRNSMVASPRHLKLILDEVFEAPERETVDCVYRALLWLAFAGVPREHAVRITVEEVDFYSMSIRHDGKEYKIPADGLKEFQKLCELDTFLFIHRNPDYEQRRPRAEGKQLLRALKDTSVEVQKISDAIYQRFAKSNWSLTYDNVQDSGLFYEKYELERFGLGVSFDAEVEQRLEALVDSNKGAKNSRSMIRSRYIEKYNQWKAIFNLQGSDTED